MLTSSITSLLLPAILLRRTLGLRFIGLTGGISTGKSAVSSYLTQQHKYTIIDFDQISREVVQPHHRSGALTAIQKEFGDSVINSSDGTLNRGALGQMIFSDPTKRKKLDRLMLIPIWSTFFLHVYTQAITNKQRELILDVPLLFEAKMNLLCSETICVVVDSATQLERLQKRDNITSEIAQKKIASQWSLDRKAALADTVIENNGSLSDLHTKLDQWNARHQREKKEKWWKEWIPTVPVVILTAIASPILLGLNYFLQSKL